MAETGRDDATTRRARIAEAITAHRRAGSQSAVFFGPKGDDAPVVEYVDREITVDVDDGERDRLDDLLGAFPVFKIAQPATRKSPAGEVHVSALADPKHISDFLDRLVLDVYEFEADYELAIAEP